MKNNEAREHLESLYQVIITTKTTNHYRLPILALLRDNIPANNEVIPQEISTTIELIARSRDFISSANNTDLETELQVKNHQYFISIWIDQIIRAYSQNTAIEPHIGELPHENTPQSSNFLEELLACGSHCCNNFFGGW